MKKISRVAALFLCALLTFGATSGCKKDEKGNNVSETAGNGSENSELFKVPEGIAKGKEFDMYLAMRSFNYSYIAEEETGDELNDALYMRNKLVEAHTGAKLNFTISTRATTGTDQSAEASQIRTLIQSGDDTYDVFAHAQRADMFNMVQEGLFVNWYDVPYIDINNPWWYSNVARDICFGNTVYYMTGDYNLNSFAETECLMFNKTLLDEIGLDYPYQLVFDGEWTHDKFVEYIKAATKDLNGDGKMEPTVDRYGFGGWKYEQFPALYIGYGGENIVKDDNNLPILNIDNELTYNIVDAMIEVFDNEGAAYFQTSDGGSIDNTMFNEGRLLFNDSFFSHVPATRQLENIDIGFIPFPKLDKDQKEYYSRTANISGLTFIPVTNKDLEMTGAVLESLAYFSQETILNTYFDIILTIKSTRDIESEQMIPIIRNSSRFGDVYIGFDGGNMIQAKSNTLASYIASNADKWDLMISDLADFYED